MVDQKGMQLHRTVVSRELFSFRYIFFSASNITVRSIVPATYVNVQSLNRMLVLLYT